MTHPVDTYVGTKIRQRRRLMGLTQQQLAERVGIKFQQIQKYETGKNRVSASRIWEISHTLEVPVGFFFEGLAEKQMSAKRKFGLPNDILADKDAIKLLRSYYTTPKIQRNRLLELACAISCGN